MKSTDNPSDNDLLRSISEGDEQAFCLLYGRRHGIIYRFALHMCGSPALAEDVTQDVFLVLLRESHSFDPTRGSLNAFLFGVARNQLLRRIQRERFYVSIDEDSNEEERLTAGEKEPWEQITRNETIESVRKAILSLPDRYREVVILCDLEEMSYVEAAELLDCAIGTIRSRLHRGRALLIDKLRPEASDDAAAEVKSARCFA